ncbi:putative E3 ubiquitin-protein ligase SINAT1 [Folsomia candida]|uniref:Putative E3 ubiquitin-protein ligase SINAT1 n=1 Tax=Folsomia candida TaxID=158441 RepID=A0A226DM83_FOLCA|nr:putative E3 ubiquitin-protein ligase SINAT1 [Folsomia candida]OXA45721.1 putative E3 ubiquitin-protein ligase SINAT1 [Folsomia candida]
MTGRRAKSSTNGGADTSRRTDKRTAATPSSKKRVKYFDPFLGESSSDEEVEVRGARPKNTSTAETKKSKISDDREESDEKNEPPKEKTARSGTSASDKQKDDEGVPPVRPEFGDHLDCTICLDLPASPIHSCANGHLICGICADKVQKCGMCQTALHVSAFAERLSRQLDLKLSCLNQNSGCTEVISATEMKKHLLNCSYRDIICIEGSSRPTKVAMHEYVKHLKEHHQCRERSSRRYSLTLKDNKISLDVSGHKWPIEILEKDGNTFLLHSRIGADTASFWMTVLGGKETAEKYMFEFKLLKDIAGGKQVEASWKMPVFAFHERPIYVKCLPYYVVMPGENVGSLHQTQTSGHV